MVEKSSPVSLAEVRVVVILGQSCEKLLHLNFGLQRVLFQVLNCVLCEIEVALELDSFVCVHGMHDMEGGIFSSFRRKRLSFHVSDGVVNAKELDFIVADEFTES